MRNYNKYKKYNKKNRIVSPIKIILVFLVLMVIMAIGYAAFNDTSIIQGSANVGSFTITYNLNGGTNVENPITTYDATTNAPLPIPTKEGYTFYGWYDNDALTGNALITTPTRTTS